MFDRLNAGAHFAFTTFQSIHLSDQIQTIFDLANFAAGFVGLYTIVENYILVDRDISKVHDNLPYWQQKAFKIADICGSLSLIVRAAKSNPAVSAWRWGVQLILSQEALARFFGSQGVMPSTNIVHTASTMAFLFGVPSTIKTFCSLCLWISSRLKKSEEEDDDEDRDQLGELFKISPIRTYSDFSVTASTVTTVTRAAIMLTPTR